MTACQIQYHLNRSPKYFSVRRASVVFFPLFFSSSRLSFSCPQTQSLTHARYDPAVKIHGRIRSASMKVAGAVKPAVPTRRRTRVAARYWSPGSRRGSLPETPLLKWKTDEKERNRSVLTVEEDGGDVGSRCEGRRRECGFSARKMAAGLWWLQAPEEDGGGQGGAGSCKERGGTKHMRSTVTCRRNRKVHNTEEKDVPDSPPSVSSTTKGFLFKLSSSVMEGATKWNPDPVSFKKLDEVNQTHSQKKLVNKKVNSVSVISALESELECARSHITELETERRSSKKKLEYFLKKVNEEKTAWRRREHEKICAFLDDIKSDLSLEKKTRQRIEIVNSKLVDELAGVKLSAKRLMQEYEKERKTRALVEEVCDELAQEIEEDKAEVDSLKRETTRLDEERKILQMAEVWREERVQMKLLDAKMAMEEKYSQMSKLIAHLESFCLRSRNVTPKVKDIREAELLMKNASSINIRDLKEFIYGPSDQDDISAVLEEVAYGGNNAKENEQCVTYSPPSHASKVHTLSPEVDSLVKVNGKKSRHHLGSMSCNADVEEDESGWETVSNVEDRGSSYSPKSVNDGQWNDALGGEPPITEITEVCSVPLKQQNGVSSIVRLRKSNAENCKLVSVKGMNGGVSNRKISNGDIGPPEHGSGKGGFSPTDLVGQWSPPECSDPSGEQKAVSIGLKGHIRVA